MSHGRVEKGGNDSTMEYSAISLEQRVAFELCEDAAVRLDAKFEFKTDRVVGAADDTAAMALLMFIINPLALIFGKNVYLS